MNKNMKAFLDMIAWSELGELLREPEGEGGYKILFGSTVKYPIVFRDYSDHPRVKTCFYDDKGNKVWSSAAGRYQLIQGTYDYLHKIGVMPDMTPDSQDKGAVSLIISSGAFKHIELGDIRYAIGLVRKQWASLPGAGYSGQPERRMEDLLDRFTQAGGKL